jgi:hypothetical protein
MRQKRRKRKKKMRGLYLHTSFERERKARILSVGRYLRNIKVNGNRKKEKETKRTKMYTRK